MRFLLRPLLLVMLFSGPSYADSVVYQTGFIDGAAEFTIDASTSGDFSFGAPLTVTGLQQFNPALGTLQGISFELLAGELVWDVSLFGELDFSGDDYNGTFEASLQGDLVYNQGGGGAIVLVTNGGDIFLNCSGQDDGGPGCGDDISDSVELVFGLPVSWPISEFAEADIIGTGDVIGLQLAINLFDASFTESEGLSFMEVFGSAAMDGANVQVGYFFDPVVVPVPAAAWLFGSALLGLAGVARRKKA